MKNKDSSKYSSSKSKSKADRKREKISRLKYIPPCGPKWSNHFAIRWTNGLPEFRCHIWNSTLAFVNGRLGTH